MLYCIILYSIILYSILLYSILFYYIILYYILLYYIVLYYIIFYYIILYYIVLYYILFYYIILYCIVYLTLKSLYHHFLHETQFFFPFHQRKFKPQDPSSALAALDDAIRSDLEVAMEKYLFNGQIQVHHGTSSINRPWLSNSKLLDYRRRYVYMCIRSI